jgi:hypothetical protein
MPTNTIYELPHNADMDEIKAVEFICKYKKHFIPIGKPLPLSQIFQHESWQNLNQGQKGYVGKVFYALCNALGFEYAGKGMSGTTNLYRLTEYVDL